MLNIKKFFINKKILDDQYLKIKEDFKELGIDVKELYLLKETLWKQMLTCLKKMLEEFPEVKGIVKEINFEKTKNGIAEVHFFQLDKKLHYEKAQYFDITQGLCISFNKHYFLDSNTFATKMKLENLPIDSGYVYATAHEFGHVVDIVWSMKSYKFKHPEAVTRKEVANFLYNALSSQHIIENIIWSLFPKKNRNQISINDKLSEFMHTSEAFAEAFAYKYCGIENTTTRLILEHYKNERG